MKKKFQILALSTFSVFSFSCLKTEDYSVEPQISFKNYVIGSTTDILGNPAKVVALTFSFTDGDGDIGLGDGDTLPPFDTKGNYYYNLCTTKYKKTNGIFTEVAENPELRNYRIQPLPSIQNKKAIKGDIEIKSKVYQSTGKDTLKYTLFIYDRALHKSNVITTSEIIL